MENTHQDRYRAGCLSRFLLLPLLFDENIRPTTLYTGFIVLVGATLYHWLEGWTWLDSFYFVIVTLTTIGYGDLSPTSSLTKVITIFFAINGALQQPGHILFAACAAIRSPNNSFALLLA